MEKFSTLSSGDSIEEGVLKNITLTNAQITDISFLRCKFRSVTITQSTIKKGYFDSCHFEKCHFDLTKFIETTFTHCSFHECSLVGTDFTKILTTLGCHLTLDFCNAELSLWSRLTLSHSRFTHTRFVEADFTESIITDAAFLFCDLAKAAFDRADLRRTDLRGSRNYFVNPFETKIRKAIFSEPEVIKLLIPLDITIAPPPDEDTDR